MKIVIDEVTPFLKELKEINPDACNEALGKSGALIRNTMIDVARSKGRVNTGFSFDTKTRKRRLVSSKQGGSKSLFSRYGHLTGDKESADMADFIRFKVYDHSNKVIVGLIDVKSWRPIKYRNGKAVGNYSRTNGTYAGHIGELYEHGGEVELTEKQKNLFRASGWRDAAKEGKITKKEHPILNRAYSKSHSKAVKKFESTYLKIIDSIGIVA